MEVCTIWRCYTLISSFSYNKYSFKDSVNTWNQHIRRDIFRKSWYVLTVWRCKVFSFDLERLTCSPVSPPATHRLQAPRPALVARLPRLHFAGTPFMRHRLPSIPYRIVAVLLPDPHLVAAALARQLQLSHRCLLMESSCKFLRRSQIAYNRESSAPVTVLVGCLIFIGSVIVLHIVGKFT